MPMYRAIVTKFLGPTSHHKARVKACVDGHKIIVPWDGAAQTEENHWRAANSLAIKLGWIVGHHDGEKWELVGGSLPAKHGGYCFVLIPKK